MRAVERGGVGVGGIVGGDDDGDSITGGGGQPKTKKSKQNKQATTSHDTSNTATTTSTTIDALKGVKRPLTTTQYTQLEKLLKTHVYKTISYDGLRDAYILFLTKPDKKLYTDYYIHIHQPISLKEISLGIRKHTYITFYDIECDFTLLVLNAKTYNSDQSDVYRDAEQLRRVFYKQCYIQGLLSAYNIDVDDEGYLTTLPPLPVSYTEYKQAKKSDEFLRRFSIHSIYTLDPNGGHNSDPSPTSTPIKPKKHTGKRKTPSSAVTTGTGDDDSFGQNYDLFDADELEGGGGYVYDRSPVKGASTATISTNATTSTSKVAVAGTKGVKADVEVEDEPVLMLRIPRRSTTTTTSNSNGGGTV